MAAAVYVIGSRYGLTGAAAGLVVAAFTKLAYVTLLAQRSVSRAAAGWRT
jgi:hypothetical protein